MDIALLGLDPVSLAILAALKQDRRHQLAAVYDVGPAERSLLVGATDPRGVRDAWEELLHESVAGAVVVAALESPSEDARDRRADQLRKLVQSGHVLVLVQPACEAIVGYELEMIRRDSNTRVIPVLPDVPAALLSALREMIAQGDAGPLGRIEQLALERGVPSRDAGALRTALSRDAALLWALAGPVRRVSALGQALLPDAPFHLNATLETTAQILARWSLQPNRDAPPARLVLLGTRGQATAVQEQPAGPWTVYGPAGVSEFPVDPAGDVLQALEAPSSSTDSFLSWIDASRAQEVAESIERSAMRGKTIELFHDELSEEGTFKGVMAVGSCGILMLTLLILIVGAMIEGLRLPFVRSRQRDQATQDEAMGASSDGTVNDATEAADPPPAERSLWIRLWPVYPFLLFLLLQVLNVLFIRPSAPRAGREAAGTTHSRAPPP